MKIGRCSLRLQQWMVPLGGFGWLMYIPIYSATPPAVAIFGGADGVIFTPPLRRRRGKRGLAGVIEGASAKGG